jgi:hypothetical protein
MDGNLLELARGLDSEVVGEGSGDDPGCEVAPPSDAAERVAHERPRVPQRPVPSPRRRHLPAPQPQLRARPTNPTALSPSCLVWGSAREKSCCTRTRQQAARWAGRPMRFSGEHLSFRVFVCASEAEIYRGFFPVKSNSFLRFFLCDSCEIPALQRGPNLKTAPTPRGNLNEMN